MVKEYFYPKLKFDDVEEDPNEIMEIDAEYLQLISGIKIVNDDDDVSE